MTTLTADGRASCIISDYVLRGDVMAIMGFLISFANAGGDGQANGLSAEQAQLLSHVMTDAQLVKAELLERHAPHAHDFQPSITLLKQVIADPSLPSGLRFIFAFELGVLERRQKMIDGMRAERELSLSTPDQSCDARLVAAA